ncbi:hypothetical protein TNCV_777761 [Trichonephila clavipes]|nr:hypothetical protein TNCV_777761 [Trichonephila clavipes]
MNDGRNFGPRSNSKDETRAGTSSPNFHTKLTEGFGARTDLMRIGSYTRRIFSSTTFRTHDSITQVRNLGHSVTVVTLQGLNMS